MTKIGDIGISGIRLLSAIYATNHGTISAHICQLYAITRLTAWNSLPNLDHTSLKPFLDAHGVFFAWYN